MDSPLLAIHLACAGIWLGCVLTEALFERALLGKGREQELILVELHKRVDLFVEIPAFVGVLISGAWMFAGTEVSPAIAFKIVAGLLAIAANVYCVWLVFRRAAVASLGQWEAFARLDHLQHRFGAWVLLAILVALITGIAAH